MKKWLFVLALVGVIAVPFVYAEEQQSLNSVVRVRVVMDLLKDGGVTTATNYADDKVDYIAPDIGMKYVDAFVSYFGGPADGTNAEKATFYLNCLRRYHRDIYAHEKEKLAGNTAKQEAETEVETDLGTEEQP